MVTRTNNTPTPDMPTSVSILVAFYNNFDFLARVLASLEVQSCRDFEVIVCDDGSRPEVVARLHAYMHTTPLRMTHLWHADTGFRKNEILNHGIVNAHADYLIFIDGDCVLHPQFVADHYARREKNTLLAGRRVNLTPWVTQRLTPTRIRHGFLHRHYPWIFLAILWMKDNNALKGLRLTSVLGRRFANRKPRGVVGSNFSVHKADLLAINGFDMRYQGPGIGEDSDIEYRLRLAGCVIRPLTHAAIQYHLYHRLLARASDNDRIFATVQANRNYWTGFGIQELIHVTTQTDIINPVVAGGA
ncbi:MAG: glycosyltransferase [Pseudomonadota bacterium]